MARRKGVPAAASWHRAPRRPRAMRPVDELFLYWELLARHLRLQDATFEAQLYQKSVVRVKFSSEMSFPVGGPAPPNPSPAAGAAVQSVASFSTVDCQEIPLALRDRFGRLLRLYAVPFGEVLVKIEKGHVAWIELRQRLRRSPQDPQELSVVVPLFVPRASARRMMRPLRPARARGPRCRRRPPR